MMRFTYTSKVKKKHLKLTFNSYFCLFPIILIYNVLVERKIERKRENTSITSIDKSVFNP